MLGEAATKEVMMFTRLTLLALTMISVAGLANAKTIYQPPVQEPPIVDADMPPTHGLHQVAITDEYGFRYDRWGNRLNAAGYVIAPPHTPADALVIQNGPAT
jgi:hypothetical protein